MDAEVQSSNATLRAARGTFLHAQSDGEDGAGEAEVRVETLNGREHLVAPVVLVREGVLNGTYVPADEIRRSTAGWNGVPVTVNHPVDEDGAFTFANQPAYREQSSIGWIFDARFNGERSALIGDAWVDVQRAVDLGDEAKRLATVLAKHHVGDPAPLIEVSTGYWTDPMSQPGVFNEEHYDSIDHRILPDHLAFLTDEVGACSIEDGCGTPRANETASNAVSNAVAALAANCCGDCGGSENAEQTGDGPGDERTSENMSDHEEMAEKFGADPELIAEIEERLRDQAEEASEEDAEDEVEEEVQTQESEPEEPVEEPTANAVTEEQLAAMREEMREELRGEFASQIEAREASKEAEALKANIRAYSDVEEEHLPDDVDALKALAKALKVPHSGADYSARATGEPVREDEPTDWGPIGPFQAYREEEEA